ncbi:MAG: class I SAM-dependent methyltransferase [Candidatus Aminicenantes bacterium]|nr:class I SAM-dependent methyltransferase [Candidatus Aminicenantes bacterium]
MIKKFIPAVLCFSLMLTPSFQVAQQKQLDVPYVPTKYPVVDEMLRMADIQKSDIVYDLGCGDGRLVVGAAQKYGAHGVGFDIDPERIQESWENATKAGVKNLVQFFEQDLFQADFHEATAMTIYLLTSVNLRLRPKLLRELRPGTRLVSHNFGMGEWKPDQSSEVMVDDISHDVFLWIIPANVSGTWTWNMGKPAVKGEMNLEQHFQVPSGSATVGGAATEIKDLTLKGDQIRFVIDRPVEGKLVSMVFEGKVAGHNISGTIKFQAGGKEMIWEWKARRNLATEKPIDAEQGRTSRFTLH